MPTLNLKEIFKTTARFSGFYKIKPEELDLPPELGELKGPVEVEIQIEKALRGYEVNLSIKGSIELECSRCLTPFIKDLDSTETIRLEKYPEKPSISLKAEDLNVFFLEDEENFNLADLIREQIILSIPTKPLCRVDCQIPTLEEPEEDTRFSALKKLIQTKHSL
ncbi:hypothetical protein THERU_01675 [Thermocrinis ruber]|uniref:DUF177 domain-containing protein n=1 Tax=Thermocrinis ruber TaxID=75906 RepID=W0DEW5_9AQUI|nr:YceD family protein [Thermocrinis ruber]AHE95583.1 hypothetical protein THERU_01675 [Thermocrinis ruber]